MEHGWRLETVEGGGSCGGGVCLWCWSCRISVEISFLKHNLKSTEAVVHVFVCVFIEIRDEVSIELAEEYWKKISRVTLKIFLNQRALIYLMKIDKIM
ncbi:unnamed protein product, partial [Callosobruchus maculatus]